MLPSIAMNAERTPGNNTNVQRIGIVCVSLQLVPCIIKIINSSPQVAKRKRLVTQQWLALQGQSVPGAHVRVRG